MFGGDNNNNPLFPAFLKENRFQYDTNALPQLQLFENFTVPAACGGVPLNYMVNERNTNMDRSTKRSREMESVSRGQKYPMALNNKFCQDEAGQAACILNPNPVSTGLRLSYEEDEHNSSISSVSENMTATLPMISSLGDNLKVEIDMQREEFDRYIRLQEEHIIKGVRELKQRHTASFLSTIEKGVGRRLQEKQHEIENMNRKNKELMERIKQATVEVHSWHYRAKYNESVVNALKSNLQQVMAQGVVHGKEGYGDNELDDAASCTNQNHLGFADGLGNSNSAKQVSCRGCKVNEVAVLLLPCRHLCLCKDCEGFVDVCPVCRVMKTASVQVRLS